MRFRLLSLAATAATYFLIFVGGLVRVSGAGLGCPDWPKCFGRWIPPVRIEQIPPEIDPALFNFTLAWIEYINRLIGVGVGFLILSVALYAIFRFRHRPKILFPAILAVVLTAFQGWQGGKVVASELEPMLVSVHMAIAFLIVSLLIYVTHQAYHLDGAKTTLAVEYPAGITKWAGIMWLLIIIQVIAGTHVRGSIEIMSRRFPLLNPAELLAEIGAVSYFHSLLGIIIALVAMAMGVIVIKDSRDFSSIAIQCAWALAGLGFFQIIFGMVLFLFGNPPVIQVLHLWIAALLSGIALLFFLTLKKGSKT